MEGLKKLNADVVVCGSGSSGLVAALTARYGRASVIILEKRTSPGGTSTFTEGLFAVESPMQVRNHVGITRDEAFRKHMEYSHWRGNARLVKAIIDKSSNTIEWLQQQGLEFEGPAAMYPNGPMVWHLIKGKIPRGATLINALVEKAKKNGIEIYLGTRVKSLLMDEGNRVIGVVTEDKDGNTLHANARAVIVSTGDFVNNREMLEKYTNFGGGAIPYFDLNMTGDGIQMAWAVGAAPEGAAVSLGAPGIQGEGFNSHLMPAARQPYLWVNQQGQRFCAEDIAFHFPFALNALANQKNGIIYTIFDEGTKKYMMETGIVHGRGEYIPVTTKLVNLDADIQRGDKEGKAFVADSLDGLAEKIGLNSKILRTTVDEYNRCCEKNHDDLFAKDPKYLQPVKKPNFYAVRSHANLMATLGGIMINHKAEVLNKDHEVIRGLYATGNCAGGMYGDSYALSVTSGMALAFAINSGRIAGETVLQYIGRSVS